MKTSLFRSLYLLGIGIIASTANAGEIFSDIPASPDGSAKYVFYLHGSGIEKQGEFDAGEKFRDVVKVLASKDLIVITEAREEGTKFHRYGEKVAQDVRKLAKSGVPLRNITVAGYSKGGRISLRTAAILSEPDVNYVILAGCLAEHKKWHAKFIRKYAGEMQGNILSIYDDDDTAFSSCKPYFSVADGELKHKELKLSTGQGHQLFHHPDAVWIEPLIEWANSRAVQ